MVLTESDRAKHEAGMRKQASRRRRLKAKMEMKQARAFERDCKVLTRKVELVVAKLIKRATRSYRQGNEPDIMVPLITRLRTGILYLPLGPRSPLSTVLIDALGAATKEYRKDWIFQIVTSSHEPHEYEVYGISIERRK